MKHAKLYVSFLFTFCLVNSAYGEVSYTPAVKSVNSRTVPKIKIYGQIKTEDIQQFHLLKEAAKISATSIGLKPIDRYPLLIELDSLGGSVSAAIAIGKEIREANPFVVKVSESAYCVSACVLILAGAVTRNVKGLVGIHRPYLDDDKAYTVSKQKQSYSEMEKSIKDYLSSVNVPTSLYDAMFRIPPEKVRYLTITELQEYNLNEDDPYYKEAKDAKNAKELGLSKSEYKRRNSICENSQSNEEANNCFSRLFK